MGQTCVTRKKSPNVYKSYPKMISLEKWKILTPLQKLPKNVGDLSKLIVAKGFKKLPKVQKIATSGHTGPNPFVYFRFFLYENTNLTKWKSIVECLGFEPGAPGLRDPMIPLSYGSTRVMNIFNIEKTKIKKIRGWGGPIFLTKTFQIISIQNVVVDRQPCTGNSLQLLCL